MWRSIEWRRGELVGITSSCLEHSLGHASAQAVPHAESTSHTPVVSSSPPGIAASSRKSWISLFPASEHLVLFGAPTVPLYCEEPQLVGVAGYSRTLK